MVVGLMHVTEKVREIGLEELADFGMVAGRQRVAEIGRGV